MRHQCTWGADAPESWAKKAKTDLVELAPGAETVRTPGNMVRILPLRARDEMLDVSVDVKTAPLSKRQRVPCSSASGQRRSVAAARAEREAVARVE